MPAAVVTISRLDWFTDCLMNCGWMIDCLNVSVGMTVSELMSECELQYTDSAIWCIGIVTKVYVHP